MHRNRWTRPRTQARCPLCSNGMHGGEGSLRRRDSGRKDGRRPPGPVSCLDRPCSVRRQSVAWRCGLHHWRLPVPAVFRGRKASRLRRPTTSVATHRPHRGRGAPCHGVLRERCRAPFSRIRRGRGTTSRPGLRCYGGNIQRERDRGNAPTGAPVHPGLRPRSETRRLRVGAGTRPRRTPRDTAGRR